MLSKGFFVRGAIVKGKLYHDEHMVFGEAQLQTYQLEREVVRYPRIMITGAVATDVQREGMTHFGYQLIEFIAEADDGPRYLDVLANIPHKLRDCSSGPEPAYAIDRFNAMAEQIQRRFDESRDNPKHFEKVQWFAKYWNSVAREWGVDAIFRQASDGRSRVLV